MLKQVQHDGWNLPRHREARKRRGDPEDEQVFMDAETSSA
jgi:hypothetical protein